MFGRGRGRGSGPPIDSGAVIQEGIGRGGTGMGGGEFEHGGGPIHNTNSQQQSEPPAAGGFANGRGRGGGFGMGRGGLGISGGGGSLDNPPQSEPPAPGGFARGRGGIGNGRGGFGLSTGAIDSASGQQQSEPSAPAIGSFGRGGRGRGGAGIGRGVGEMTSEMAAEPAGDRNMGSVGFGGGRGRGGGPLFSGSNAAPISGNGRGSGGIGNGRGGFALSTGAIDSASGQQQSEPPAPAIGSFGRGGRGRGGAGIGRGVGEMTSEMAAEPAGDRNMGSMGFGGGRGRGGGPLFSGSNSAPISGNGRGRGGLNSGSTAESSFGTSRGGRGRGGREGNGSIHSGSQTFEESGPSRLRLGPNADTLGNPDSKSMGNPDAGYSAKHPTSSYVPSKRTIEELFNEDSAVQTLYMGIADSDDPVSTTVAGAEKLDKIEDWNEMHLHPKLLENIVDKAKYVRPRKIQENVLPFVLKGIDVICLSETGSGKTGCYMIPIIQKILSLGEEATKAGHKITPTALIVFPTRELCLQVYEQGLKLASGTFIHVAKAFGEYNTGANIGELRRGCHILCATPGRLKDFIGKGIFDFSKLHFFVLDEADRMLEMGFADDIREILSTKGFPPKDQRQNLLFSATIPDQIQSLADEMVRADHVTASNSKPNAPNTRIDASFLQVEQDNKSDLLKELLEKERQEAQAKDPANPEYRRTLVFVGTCRDANKLTLFLCEAGIQAQSVNSDRTQAERESTLNKFRKGEINVIVATDVMARGIDIKDLDLVVNYDMPNEIFTYIHRIGRTGRLKTGYAISFVNDQTDGELIKEITEGLRKEGKPIPEFWAGSNKQW